MSTTLEELVAKANHLAAELDMQFAAVHQSAWRELYEQPHIQALFKRYRSACLAIGRARWEGEP